MFVTIELTEAQATTLLAIVDANIATRKNQLVSATLSTGDYRDRAESIARDIEAQTAIRTKLYRARREGL